MDRNDKLLKQFNVEVDFHVSYHIYKFGDYRIEIVIDLEQFEYGYWLYHKKCGIKSFMHGHSMEDMSYTEFLLLVLSGLKDDINFYDEEYNF